jgi:hypothetical protein
MPFSHANAHSAIHDEIWIGFVVDVAGCCRGVRAIAGIPSITRQGRH